MGDNSSYPGRKDDGGADQVLGIEGARRDPVLTVEYDKMWRVRVWSSV